MIALVGVPNPDRPGSELVKAFTAVRADYRLDGEEALKKEIQGFARERLSPYEVPKILEIRKELPLTSVGKIDKKQLRSQTR